MDKTENQLPQRQSETKIIFFMILLTVIVIVCMFVYGNHQNKTLPVNSSITLDSGDTSSSSEGDDYNDKKRNLEAEYSLLIQEVQDKLTDAETVHQQDAISSYYTVEAIELLLKQNSLMIEQNDKIIDLLTELNEKK